MPIEIDQDACLLCEACNAVCPTDAVRKRDDEMVHCVTCGACAKACPFDALVLEDLEREVDGEKIEVKRIARRPDECVRDDPPQCGQACPMDMIYLDDEYPYIHGFCVMCLRCMDICPIDAIGVKGQIPPKSKAPEHPEDKEMYVHPDRCVGCAYCLQVCPVGAIKMEPTDVEFYKTEDNNWTPVYVDPDSLELKRGRRVAVIDDEKCTACTLCAQVCPWGAITSSKEIPSQEREVKNEVDEETCVGCGLCVDVCPGDLIKIEGGVAKVPEKCPACKLCERACPVDAISINVSYERTGEMK